MSVIKSNDALCVKSTSAQQLNRRWFYTDSATTSITTSQDDFKWRLHFTKTVLTRGLPLARVQTHADLDI